MLGKVAMQTEALNYSETYGVNVADIWKERLRSYLGRSHGRVET
jgi:FtsZ-binding cell division protein ZapB